MENGRFIVRMLGGFSVYYGERPIVSERSRNSKVTQLLEYLLMNRRRGVPQEELIEVLLAGEESESPANVLKNLIYRLRKLFIASEGVAGKQPLHKERQGDQHKQGDNGIPNPLEHIFDHTAISSFP